MIVMSLPHGEVIDKVGLFLYHETLDASSEIYAVANDGTLCYVPMGHLSHSHGFTQLI